MEGIYTSTHSVWHCRYHQPICIYIYIYMIFYVDLGSFFIYNLISTWLKTVATFTQVLEHGQGAVVDLLQVSPPSKERVCKPFHLLPSNVTAKHLHTRSMWQYYTALPYYEVIWLECSQLAAPCSCLSRYVECIHDRSNSDILFSEQVVAHLYLCLSYVFLFVCSNRQVLSSKLQWSYPLEFWKNQAKALVEFHCQKMKLHPSQSNTSVTLPLRQVWFLLLLVSMLWHVRQ